MIHTPTPPPLQRRKGSLSLKRRKTTVAATGPLRVCVPVRTSTKEQVQGLEVQRRETAAYAKQHGIVIHGFYEEQVSAVRTAFMERDHIQKMMRDMETHGITTVLVLRIDRAFRSVIDLCFAMQEFERRQWRMLVVELNIDTATPHGKMQAQLMAVLAEQECLLRRQRQLQTFEMMRAESRACSGSIRYGWQRHPEWSADPKHHNHRLPLIAHPKEQGILRTIIELHDDQYSFQEVASILNASGKRTKMAGQTIKRNGKAIVVKGKWTYAHVQSVLEHAVLDDGETIIAA